ncbi:MAG: PH domain-containing protein [Anaerolineaceae bacterium]|nr:PH domain-containing protein [Anaerolineaceae bacterium]
MNTIQFRPHMRYPFKLYIAAISGTLFTFIFFIGLAVEHDHLSFLVLLPLIVLAFSLVGATLYYSSISYHIDDNEVIVRAGVLRRTVKHVPLKNVTNITVTRDVRDRILGIGSLSIQTAGTGGIIPEEVLAGIRDLDDLYAYVAQRLRSFRADMSNTQTRDQAIADPISMAILQELRAIRQLLSQQQQHPY